MLRSLELLLNDIHKIDRLSNISYLKHIVLQKDRNHKLSYLELVLLRPHIPQINRSKLIRLLPLLPLVLIHEWLHIDEELFICVLQLSRADPRVHDFYVRLQRLQKHLDANLNYFPCLYVVKISLQELE